jgi:hypothetical protein
MVLALVEPLASDPVVPLQQLLQRRAVAAVAATVTNGNTAVMIWTMRMMGISIMGVMAAWMCMVVRVWILTKVLALVLLLMLREAAVRVGSRRDCLVWAGRLDCAMTEE